MLASPRIAFNDLVPISRFRLQLENSIKKIEHLESCDCKKSCSINGSLSREDGDRWDSGCDECQCKSGVVTCIKRPCEELKCKNPVKAEGECCPKCLSKFDLDSRPESIH